MLQLNVLSKCTATLYFYKLLLSNKPFFVRPSLSNSFKVFHVKNGSLFSFT
jgi:hypothetical protein